MLFKVKSGVDVFDLNPGLRAIKEFDLTARQMEAVILFADYDSPFRSQPERERREMIAKAVGYPFETDGSRGNRLDKNGRSFVDGHVKSIEAAIVKYRELQYDENRAILAAYTKQIQDIVALMAQDKGKDAEAAADLTERATKLAKALPDLKRDKTAMMELMNIGKENAPELNTVLAADIPLEQEPDEQTLSMLDIVMEAKKNKE